MQIELEMPQEFLEQIRNVVLTTLKEAANNQRNANPSKEWMNLKDAAKYVGVSYNTFIKFRLLGLKVCELDGVKRVSKKEIDRFLETNSY